MSYGGITGQRPEELEQELKAHVDNKNNPHSVTKEQLGLGNVETWELIGEETITLKYGGDTYKKVTFSKKQVYQKLKIKAQMINCSYNSTVTLATSNSNVIVFKEGSNVPENSVSIVESVSRYYWGKNVYYMSGLNERHEIALYNNRVFAYELDFYTSVSYENDSITFKVQLYGQK